MSEIITYCDILVKGARVIDTVASVDAVMDIAVTGGVITAVAPGITAAATETIDAAGKIATPGLIDLHAHPYPEAHWGVSPDTAGVLSGVTTVFDAGSAGVMTFPHFLETHIKPALTDVFVFLHINPIGEVMLPEVWDREKILINPSAVAEMVMNNRQYIRGIKNRAIGSLIRHWGLEAVDMALDICERCAIPFMVHIGLDPDDDTPEDKVIPFMRGLLEKLRPGDIITHAFTGKRGRIFREDGLFDELIRKAVARGVILDACVGRTNISWESLRIAKERGFRPEALGTDLTSFGMESALKNMGVTMSKMVAAGFGLQEVITWVTAAPSAIMSMPERGTLAPGTVADITLLDIQQGRYDFLDKAGGEMIRGDMLIAPWAVLKNGTFIKSRVTGGPTY